MCYQSISIFHLGECVIMALFNEVITLPLNRRKRTFLKKLAVFTTIWLVIALYTGRGGLLHVRNDGPRHIHVGVGPSHSDETEGHSGTSSGAWEARVKGPLEADDPRVVEFLRDRHLQAPGSRPYNLDAYQNRLRYESMDSWRFLHKAILELFKDSPPGFFIEAGALDGQYLSNTLHLEKEYGWTGLLIEPNPSSYNELLKKNRHCWSSNTCFALTPYPKEMVLEMIDTREQAATSQAMWVIRGGSFLQEGARTAQKYQAKTHLSTYAVVQCFPFLTYWKALNLTRVDLFSLDVEGAEEQILSTIPWDAVDIRTLILEHYGSSKEPDEIFVNSVEQRGYSLYDYNIDKNFIGDYIFVKKEST